MKTSNNGTALIKNYESFQPNAYACPAGVLTIGYGHTGGVKKGDTITASQAELLLKEDLSTFENFLNSQQLTLNQHQFDALVSFIYNVGTGNFAKSTLLKKLKANAPLPQIETELLKWRFAAGKELKGLLNRRKSEYQLFAHNQLTFF